MFCFFSDLKDKSTSTDVVDDQEVVKMPFLTRSEHVEVEPSTSSSSDLQPMPSRKSHQKGKGKNSKVQSGDDVRCEVCGGLYKEITNHVEIWIQCNHRGCTYWTHPKCHEFSSRSEANFQKLTFYCPKHRSLH